MAVWTAKFVVRSKPEAWLREQWELTRPLRQSYGCTYARLLSHATEPDTYFVFAEFLTLGGARGYERAAALELGGEGLAQFVERQLVDFYSGDAFDAAALQSLVSPASY
jgi:hypothetical protein